MKWVHKKGQRIWRLQDDKERWLGSIAKSEDSTYFVDLPFDKWPYPTRKCLGPRDTLPAAKKLLITAIVADRISQ